MIEEEIALSKNNQLIWTKAIEITIIALVILTPFAFYPYLMRIFNPAKELIFEILVIIGMMFWGFKIVNAKKYKLRPSSFNFPIISFIAICILSILWSDSPMVSLKELPLFLAGPLLYFITINNIYHKSQVEHLINAILIIGTLLGIYGILQYQGIDFSFWLKNIGRQRVFGFFGNVNYFAEYLIIPLSIAVSLFLVSQNRIIKILFLIEVLAMGGCLISTFTRGSYLGSGVSLIFMFFLFLFSRGKSFIKDNKKYFIVIILVIIVIVSLFIIPNPLNKSGTVISKIKDRTSATQLTQGYSIKRRIAIWKFTALMIKDHPLLGSGLGTFKYNTLRYQARFFDQGQNRSLYPYGIADKVHNEYLQLWAELGIIGLLIFIWLIIFYFSYGIKILKKTKDRYKQGILIGLMGAVVAVLIDAIFGFPLHLPATIALFWLVIGLTIVLGGSKKEEKKAVLTLSNSNETVRQEEEKKDKEIKKNNKQSNISRFKPLLYIGIILLTVLLSVIVARPFIAKTHWYYANKEVENKNWDKAIINYKEALKWDHYLGEAYYYIGKILKNKGIYSVAMDYFEKAEKYIDHPELPRDLFIVYLKKGQLDKAAIKLKQAISYQENEKLMLPLYSELGNVYIRLERYKPAEIAFKNAIKIDPNFINAHYGLAGVYLRLNQQDKALEELQKVIKLAPNSQSAENSKEIIEKLIQEKAKKELEEKK